MKQTFKSAALSATAFVALASGSAWADQVFLDDVIVGGGSLCVGQDCVNGESFGFDTIRMKENNLRLHFQDTSVSASFPTSDWRLVANDSSNGGSNYLAIEDSDRSTQPFRVDAGAGANALRVNQNGNVGLGTASPVVELHVADGDSPTLRLEQNGSSGFTPQIWDLAGNEANFFLRDVTNASKLPFRVQPNTPDETLFMRTSGITINETGVDYDLRVESDTKTAALFVDGATGNLGLGTNTPSNELHLSDTGNIGILFDSDTANQPMRLSLSDGTAPGGGDEFRLVFAGTGPNPRLIVDEDGNLTLSRKGGAVTGGDITIPGGLISTGGGGACTVADPCDAVFDPEIYTVPSIDSHAKEMWAKKHLPAVGPIGPDAPINMTTTMLRMLNELEHAHIYIDQLNGRLKELEAQLDEG